MKRLFVIIGGILLIHGGYAQLNLLKYFPKTYVAYRATGPLVMDGHLDEPDWQKAVWTDDFVDIEGEDKKPTPLYRTRAKMLWDDNFLYIAAELEEPNIWATYTLRNSVIFHENNFEVFIDPDGDTHHYYEYEVNALGTEWDLFLTKPYRNGGIPMSAWQISGLQKGIHLKGTINNPSDKDTLWCIELAFPWEILKECAPGRRKPMPSEQWRVNFSRVEWQLDVEGGNYKKRINPDTNKPFPEYNWIWSPQGVIDMHRPELWGYVQFSGIKSGEGHEDFIINPDEYIKFALRELYYRQHDYFRIHKRYANSIKELIKDPIMVNGKSFSANFEVSNTRFKLSSISTNQKTIWHITEDGRIWSE